MHASRQVCIIGVNKLFWEKREWTVIQYSSNKARGRICIMQTSHLTRVQYTRNCKILAALKNLNNAFISKKNNRNIYLFFKYGLKIAIIISTKRFEMIKLCKNRHIVNAEPNAHDPRAESDRTWCSDAFIVIYLP